MVYLPTAYHLGLFVGIIGVVIVALMSLLVSDKESDDMSISVCSILGGLSIILAMLCFFYGGLPATAMFVGSLAISAVGGMAVISLCSWCGRMLWARMHRTQPNV